MRILVPPTAKQHTNPRIFGRRDAISSGLGRLLDEGILISDEAGRRVFDTDASMAYQALPLAVILPQTTTEVSRVLKFCSENNLKVVPRGAGTSLCGASVPLEDSVVIGLSRMNKVLDVNFFDRTATVEAGVTPLALSGVLVSQKFFYPPNPASEHACTIGGNVAMNAGGFSCLKYGVTTNNVLKVKAVLMNGEVVELGGDYLDPQGYDLLGLLNGSEGQLGIVTEVTVRILRRTEGSRLLMIACNDAEQASACAASILAEGIVPVAIEFLDKAAAKICEDFCGAGYPLDAEALLIVEIEGSPPEIEICVDRLKEIAGLLEPKSLRVSRSEEEAAAIWAGPRSLLGAVGRLSDCYVVDGVVPLAKLIEVLKQAREAAERHKLKTLSTFHAGDGNLQFLILYDRSDSQAKAAAKECGFEVQRICVDAGGCITGEHGVGLEKRDLMKHQYNDNDLGQQMRVKAAFDPQWLLNPSKVFPLDIQRRFAAGSAAARDG